MELLKTKCSKAQYTEIRQAIESYINSQINSESEHLKSVLIQEIEENLSHVADLSSFKVDFLPYLSSSSINPQRWDSKIKRNLRNIERQTKISSIENFHCAKCKGTVGTMKMQQTASGDEPMTSFITSGDCGFTFRRM